MRERKKNLVLSNEVEKQESFEKQYLENWPSLDSTSAWEKNLIPIKLKSWLEENAAQPIQSIREKKIHYLQKIFLILGILCFLNKFNWIISFVLIT